MTKLEQVIKALQLCRYDPDPGQECKFLVSCDICPYWNDKFGCREIDLFNDALELLTAQQPRVLTLEEVRLQTWDYCYIEAEVKPHSKTLETLCGTHRLYCTTSIVLERQTRGDEEYGKTWRCWTARPTEEQRDATPWGELPKEEEK